MSQSAPVMILFRMPERTENHNGWVITRHPVFYSSSLWFCLCPVGAQKTLFSFAQSSLACPTIFHTCPTVVFYFMGLSDSLSFEGTKNTVTFGARSFSISFKTRPYIFGANNEKREKIRDSLAKTHVHYREKKWPLQLQKNRIEESAMSLT